MHQCTFKIYFIFKLLFNFLIISYLCFLYSILANSKRTNCPELNKLSSELGNCSLSLSNYIKNSKSHISLKKPVNITSTTTNSSITTTTTTTTSPLKHHSIYNNISNTVDSKKNKNRSLVSSSMSKSKYYCSICHVSFISNESLSRHCMSAHGQQRKQIV